MLTSPNIFLIYLQQEKKEALPEQSAGEQKGNREHKGTYQRREDNPAREEPSSSLSSMARAIRQTTESQFLQFSTSFIPPVHTNMWQL